MDRVSRFSDGSARSEGRRLSPQAQGCAARGRVLLLLIALVAAASLAPSSSAGQQLGTDLTGLNLCLYGDCEARGSYAADPYGWTNPATLPVGSLPYVPRGVFGSGSYFRLNSGGVGVDIGSATVSLAMDPWVVEVHTVYADGGGTPHSLPGVDMTTRSRLLGLLAGVDLGRTPLAIKGLCLGIGASIPGIDSDVKLSSSGVSFLQSTDERQVDLTLGAHWRWGERDWFAVGALVNAVRSRTTASGVDPVTFAPFASSGTTNAWFTRAGLSLLPFVGAGLAGRTPAGELLGEVRLGADLAYTNIGVPDEPGRDTEVGYFGVDARVLPDAWNPLSSYLRPYVIGGTDTDGGWGIGAGIYGNGPLEFVTCNPAYSSRPLAKSIGNRVDVWAATCAVSVPF